jgi:hypothetical protein
MGPLPSPITGTLTWDLGVSPSTSPISEVVPGSAAPGDLLTVAAQVSSPISQNRRYLWELDLTIPAGPTLTATGVYYGVTQDQSPYGAGWTLSVSDQLFPIGSTMLWNQPAGELRVYGTGEARFYQDQGGGNYLSPAGDNGTLMAVAGGYSYSGPDGQTWSFNAAGLQTGWASGDGLAHRTYSYDGQNRLTLAVASDGTPSTFSYAGSPALLSTIQVANQGATHRTTTLTHTGAAGTDLGLITNPDTGAHTLSYTGGPHLLTGEAFGLLQNGWAYCQHACETGSPALLVVGVG